MLKNSLFIPLIGLAILLVICSLLLVFFNCRKPIGITPREDLPSYEDALTNFEKIETFGNDIKVLVNDEKPPSYSDVIKTLPYSFEKSIV